MKITDEIFKISDCGVAQCAQDSASKRHGVSMKDFDLLKVLGTAGKVQ